MGIFSSARRDGYYVSYGPPTYRRRYVCYRDTDDDYFPAPRPARAPRGQVTTTVRQTCAACGRFRSARWEAAHPLIPGSSAVPGICGRCQRDKTSSDERRPRHRHRRSRHHHLHSRHRTSSTEDSCCSIRDRRSPRRYRSDSRDYAIPRASSRDNVRIVIANNAGVNVRKSSTQSSSSDAVIVGRRRSIIEVPERRRSRSHRRSSSRAVYLDDGTAQYVDNIRRPARRRTRSRSSSRIRYVDEFDLPRSPHWRRRSRSRVQFLDDSKEHIQVSRSPRRISRRRAVYFDGAASFDVSDENARGRPPSGSASHQGSRDHRRGIERVGMTPVPKARGVQLIEHTVTSHHRSASQHSTRPAVRSAEPLRASDVGKDKESVHVKYDEVIPPEPHRTDPDLEKTPRATYRSIYTEGLVRPTPPVRETSGIKRSHSKTTLRVHRTFSNGRDQPEITLHENERPQNKRRRTYSSHSTDSNPTALPYRHVRASSPPSPHANHSDYLSSMLQSAHITPPSHQRSRSQLTNSYVPPTPPRSRSQSRLEDANYHDENPARGTEYEVPTYQYSPPAEPVLDLYGNPINEYGYGPGEEYYGSGSRAAREYDYDWMD